MSVDSIYSINIVLKSLILRSTKRTGELTFRFIPGSFKFHNLRQTGAQTLLYFNYYLKTEKNTNKTPY